MTTCKYEYITSNMIKKIISLLNKREILSVILSVKTPSKKKTNFLPFISALKKGNKLQFELLFFLSHLTQAVKLIIFEVTSPSLNNIKVPLRREFQVANNQVNKKINIGG